MQTKADSFDERLAGLSGRMTALGHPARLAILEELAERNECICGELVDTLPLAQATVSRHLKTLKEAGLIRGEIDGPRVCYCLDKRALRELAEEFTRFFDGLDLLPETENCC